MYTSIKDFLADWKDESASTLKVLKTLTDASLRQKVSADGRSLGFLAQHIVNTLGEMGSKAGLNIKAPVENSESPSSASAIAAEYETAAASLSDCVGTQWNDAMLSESVDMYGEKWPRKSVLSSLIRHEIHHRGQMTVLMRQAGLPVPGVCGPSREEWKQIGMKAPE
jgi:uncharacterized damage-inducible protein DinB